MFSYLCINSFISNLLSSDFVKNSDMMWKQSVWTSIIAANLAAKHLKEGGLLTLTGAEAALSGTPGKNDSCSSSTFLFNPQRFIEMIFVIDGH